MTTDRSIAEILRECVLLCFQSHVVHKTLLVSVDIYSYSQYLLVGLLYGLRSGDF